MDWCKPLSPIDDVVCEINLWLLAIAIGLSSFDLTVICALHATDLAKFRA